MHYTVSPYVYPTSTVCPLAILLEVKDGVFKYAPATGRNSYGNFTFLKTAAPTTPTAPTVNFADVKASDYFATPVNWAVDRGITAGTGFTPNTVCTRAQIITFLYRYYVAPTDNSTLIETLPKPLFRVP